MPDVPLVMHTHVKTKRCHHEVCHLNVLCEESGRYLWQVQTLTTNDLICLDLLSSSARDERQTCGDQTRKREHAAYSPFVFAHASVSSTSCDLIQLFCIIMSHSVIFSRAEFACRNHNRLLFLAKSLNNLLFAAIFAGFE